MVLRVGFGVLAGVPGVPSNNLILGFQSLSVIKLNSCHGLNCVSSGVLDMDKNKIYIFFVTALNWNQQAQGFKPKSPMLMLILHESTLRVQIFLFFFFLIPERRREDRGSSQLPDVAFRINRRWSSLVAQNEVIKSLCRSNGARLAYKERTAGWHKWVAACD